MPMSELELHCTKCHWLVVCRKEAMIGWLRSVNMLRREAKPDPDFVVELFKQSSHKFNCPKCGQHGLQVRDAVELDDEEWGMGRACEVCKAPIPAERLEALPDTRTCVRCQAASDSGEDSAEVQYCPRCGAPMTLQLTRGAGISRYVMKCTACGRS